MGELETLINGNEIFLARTQGVGYLDQQQAVAYGLTGPVARASGIDWDLRVNHPSMAYREVPVQVQVRQEGDCYARNAVRLQEIRESIRLCRVAIDQLPAGPISARTPVALRPPRGETYFAMRAARANLAFIHQRWERVSLARKAARPVLCQPANLSGNAARLQDERCDCRAG